MTSTPKPVKLTGLDATGTQREWQITQWILLTIGLSVPNELQPAFGGSTTTGTRWPDEYLMEISGTPPFPDMLAKSHQIHFDDKSTRHTQVKIPQKHPDGHFSYVMRVYY